MKIIYTFFIVVSLFMITGCQTIENKSQSAIKKENEKLSKFLQQPESELKIVMGEPDNIIKDDKGATFLVYTKKKYNITCERKFEINRIGHLGNQFCENFPNSTATSSKVLLLQGQISPKWWIIFR